MVIPKEWYFQTCVDIPTDMWALSQTCGYVHICTYVDKTTYKWTIPHTGGFVHTHTSIYYIFCYFILFVCFTTVVGWLASPSFSSITMTSFFSSVKTLFPKPMIIWSSGGTKRNMSLRGMRFSLMTLPKFCSYHWFYLFQWRLIICKNVIYKNVVFLRILYQFLRKSIIFIFLVV